TAAAVLLALALGILGAPAAAAAAVITVQVHVGADPACINGTAGPRASVKVALLTNEGRLRSSFRTRANRFGDWEGCFPSKATFDAINGGDRIRVWSDGTGRTVKVPRLIRQIDRVADTVAGRVDPGASVEITVTHRISPTRESVTTHVVTAGSDGRYILRLAGKVNLTGMDGIVAQTPFVPDCDPGVVCELPPTDTFLATAFVPFVEINFGTNRLQGWTVDAQTSFRLRSAAGELKGTADSQPPTQGLYYARLVNAAGNAVYPTAGDTLRSSLAPDARLVVPRSALEASALTDTVSGRCMARARYELFYSGGSVGGRTADDGSFVRDLSGKVDIRRTSVLTVSCRYATGDRFTRTAQAGP
ncbi:MAG TPA: hypothetical protein VNW68_07805, partial [Candidatus Limnocylindria bacterium]|nr:hypothetical protein [Candidatus Limnocylindria bacterium]